MPTSLVFTDSFPYEYTNYLSKLDTKDRKIIVSFFGLAGKPRLSIEEIAEVFRDPGINSNKIRNQLSQAMGKLRDAYDQAKLREFHSASD